MHAKNSTLQTYRRTRHGPSIESRSLFGLVTRTILFARLLLSVSCSHTPAPQAICECASHPALPTQVDAGKPAMDALASQPGPLEAEPPAAADTSDGGSSSSRPVRRAPVFNAPAAWFCVPWFYLSETIPFSRDCYATAGKCRAARPEPDWHQYGSGCSMTDRAWCTEIYRQTDARTRCFENVQACEMGRSRAAEDSLESSECIEVDRGSSSSRPVRRAPVFNVPASWYCLKWTHLMEGVPFSTDCYATTAECRAARPEPDRSLHGSGCWSAQRAWCTKIYGQADALTRCFENIKFCEKGRAYAADDGLESSECREVPAKG